LGLEGGLNPYGYAYQNPLIYSDPDGEVPWVTIPLLAALLWPHYANAPAPDAITYDGTDAIIAGIIAASEVPASPLGIVKGGIKSCVVATKNAGPSVDDLSRADGALDKSGFTKAGRSLQKHGSRPGPKWNQTDINVNRPAEANPRGQDLADDVLTTPGSQVVPNPRGGVDVIAPDGRVVRFNRDGSMQGFRE
jgi:hypothetical protein